MRPRSYFGAARVKDGSPVRKLHAGTFKDLVERYYNAPVVLPCTRQEFFSYDEDTQNVVKDGPYLCACSFTAEQRCSANADKLNLVCLDFDPPSSGNPDYPADFFSDPETVAEHLHPYNFILHTTARHTSDRPRVRVIVSLAECSVARHKEFVRHVANLLGVVAPWKGVIESNVLAQPMYRPVKFQGDAFDAILASRTNGKDMDEFDLPSTPDEEADERFYAYTDSAPQGTGIAFLPVPDLEPSDVREALDAISPDCDYRKWYTVAAALRHQFTDEEHAREAYEMFDLWSSKSESKYKGDKETWAKWKSFKPYATGRNPVTVRSLFHLAIESGWSAKKLEIQLKKTFQEWLEGEKDFDTMMSEGPERIAAMPFTTAMTENSFLGQLHKRLAQLGEAPSKPSIQKQINAAKRGKRDKEDEGSLPDWLIPFCYVYTDNEFMNVINGETLSPEAFDNTFSVQLMPKAGDPDAGLPGRPIMLPRLYALNIRNIKRVGGTSYDPRHGDGEPYFEFEGREFLNTYRQSTVPLAVSTGSKEAGKLLVGHIKKLIREPEYQDIFLDFLCMQVQHPGVKIKWAPVIQSGEGAGKGFLARIMESVIGQSNLRVVSPSMVQSQWNDWRIGAVLLVLEELFFQGASREQTTNQMKDAITDDQIAINKRNTSAATHPNLSNYLAFTNYKDQLHLKESSRRYFVIESPLQNSDQMAALHASGHFNELERLKGSGGASLRHWMLKHTIDSQFPMQVAPRTKYLELTISSSKNRLLERIEDLIQDEDYSTIADDVIWMADVEYRTQPQQANNHPPGKFLRDMGFIPYSDGKRFMIDTYRSQIWVHPDRYDETFGPAEEILRERKKKSKEMD